MHNIKVAKNTIYQLASRGISTSISILLSVMLVRLAGLDSYGEFSVAIAFIMIFVTLSDFGSTTTILRKFADQTYLKEYFYSYLIYRIFISGISFLFFSSLLLFTGYSVSIIILLIAGSPLILLNSFNRAFLLIFQAKKDFKHQFYSSLLSGFVLSISLFFLYIITGKIDSFVGILILVLNSSINLSYLFWNYRKEFTFGNFKGVSYMIILIKDSWVIGLTLMLNMLMVNIDRVIMSWFIRSEDIGVYSLAYKIFEISLIIPTYIMNIYYPILIEKMSNKIEYTFHYLNAIKKFIFIGIIVSVLMYLSSGLLVFIWGKNATSSVEVLKTLSLGTVFFYISSPMSWYLISQEKKYTLLLIYLAGLISNVVLNYVYIQQYGYMASAYFTWLSELFIVVLLLISVGGMRHSMTERSSLSE